MLNFSTFFYSLKEFWKKHNIVIALIVTLIIGIPPIGLNAIKISPSDQIIIIFILIILSIFFYFLIFYCFYFVPIKISNREFIFNTQLSPGMERFTSPVLLFNSKYKSIFKFDLNLLNSAYNDLKKWKKYVLVLNKPSTFEIVLRGNTESLNPVLHYNENFYFLQQKFEGGGKKEISFSFEIGTNQDAKGDYDITIYLVEKVDYSKLDDINEHNFEKIFNVKAIRKEPAHGIHVTPNPNKKDYLIGVYSKNKS
ncbi:hypothetical protein [Methanobacterium sp.]|uniref:hypothetical protein n=1 Tax=Methanobacterium sp. TaxID=2164 RepID=UPI002ABB8ABB|nr:hypothetical protein [Methanobacterium sp.]MDY9922809.1 hypothetical protein [Methanobacterium sp.]